MSLVIQGPGDSYSASLFHEGRQMMKMFRNTSPLVGTCPVVVRGGGLLQK